MKWTRLLGLLSIVAVAVWTVGAAFTLGRATLSGDPVLSAVAVLGLLVVSLVLAVVAGSRSPEWLSNPGYW